jgi:hypothetical protein
MATHGVFVDVIGPLGLEEEEWAEDETGDEERKDGDSDEAPEVD